jgi:FAD/FMN-containing dehydrogenase
MATESAIGRDLARVVGAENVLEPPAARFLHDETETRGLAGKATAVVFPGGRDEVAEVVGWCYEREIPIVTRGGGSGFAGGAVPLAGGVVLALDRLRAVRSFDPLFWRIEVEAGLRTADLRRLVRESGLLFPPDPGAAEDSQIGGNIATNAGGPHAFKYGVTGAWVSGLEVVVPPGELVAVGGPVRKDVAGFDLKSLLIGSEGTLGVITAAWLKLIPAPEASYPVAAFFPNTGSGCEAIERTLGSGLQVAALEYLDETTLAAAGGSFPGKAQAAAGFLVLAEADGSRVEAESLRTGDRSTRGGLRRHPRPDRDQSHGGSLALAGRGLDRRHDASRRQGERGHRRPARPPVRGDCRDGRDREAPRPAGLQLGPRR